MQSVLFLLIFFFSVLGDARATEKIVESSPSCPENFNSTWHRFPNGTQLDLSTFSRLFGEKFVMRKVLEDGPISIVQPYYAVKTDPHVFSRASTAREIDIQDEIAKNTERFGEIYAKAWTYPSAWDASVFPELLNDQNTYTFSELIEHIASKKLPFPMVYKPNRGGLGNGVVFIEPSEANVKLTLSSIQQEIRRLSGPAMKWSTYLRRLGFVYDNNKNTYTLLAPAERAAAIAKKLLTRLMFVSGGTFDSGMIEKKIDVIKYQGAAYETRHFFEGNLQTGYAGLVKKTTHENVSVVWSAHLGSSEHFSNLTDRPRAQLLRGSEKYHPLFEMFNMDEKRQIEFKDYVDQLILAEARYLVDRYRAAGFAELPIEVRGPIDLMWLPPETPGGFPRPVIIEVDCSLDFARAFFFGGMQNGPVEVKLGTAL